MDDMEHAAPCSAHNVHSNALLRHAQEMIDKGERLQASEKIWGAVAHKMRGLARKRGWVWTTHKGYDRYAQYLRRQTGNQDIATLTRSLEQFHNNFYDDHMDDDALPDGLREAKRLIRLLEEADESLGDNPPDPPGIRRLKRARPARPSVEPPREG